jgi:mRNA interferase MazF
MNDVWTPEAGDFLWADLDPTLGTEQAGRRPVLVVSVEKFNATTKRIVVLPTSSRARGWITEVPLVGTNEISGVVLCDQIRTIDWRARSAKRAGHTNPERLIAVRAKLAIILGII